MSGYKYRSLDKTPVWVFLVIAILLGAVAVYAGVLSVDLSAVGIELGPAAENRTVPEYLPETAEPVTLKMLVDHKLDRGNPAATSIRLYTDADGMDFLASVDTSSGIATFTGVPIWENETLFYQARAAAPNSADYVTYTTPLTEFVVPKGDESSVASYGPVHLWETSTSAASFNIVDQASQTIATEATQYINTTDTQLTITVSITSDCSYGTPEEFTDKDTGKHYLAGVWLVIKCTATQPTLQNSPGLVANFYASSLQFYVFNIPMIVYDADLGYQTGRTFTVGDGSTAFVASADFDFDLYDTCWASSLSGINEGSFMNGDSDLNPTAVTNKVA